MYSGIIYRATFPNNKKYYGKTKNSLNNRIKKHLADANCDNLLFHRALKKYREKVIWEIVETINEESKNILLEKLNSREIYWIEKDKTYVLKYGIKHGYNLTAGGDGGDTFSGRKHSEKTLKKMSESAKRRYKSEKNYFYGKKRPEHSEKMKGNNNPMYGSPRSEEVKQKIREKLKGKKLPRKICEYCNKDVAISIYTRYHGENCKLKP